MYARVTQYRIDPSREAEVVAKLDALSARIKGVPGIVSAHSSWRSGDGQGVTMAIYESEAAAEAAADVVKSIWSELAPFMTAPPTPNVYENVQNLLD